MPTHRRRQRGASLIMAVFILVVLSLLGAAMINLLSAGAESVAREVVSLRALFAAESGAQRQLNQIFPPGAATNTASCTAQTYSFSDLVGCADVTTSCDLKTVNSVNYVSIRSVGTCGPSAEAAVRVIEVQAKDG